MEVDEGRKSKRKFSSLGPSSPTSFSSQSRLIAPSGTTNGEDRHSHPPSQPASQSASQLTTAYIYIPILFIFPRIYTPLFTLSPPMDILANEIASLKRKDAPVDASRPQNKYIKKGDLERIQRAERLEQERKVKEAKEAEKLASQQRQPKQKVTSPSSSHLHQPCPLYRHIVKTQPHHHPWPLVPIIPASLSLIYRLFLRAQLQLLSRPFKVAASVTRNPITLGTTDASALSHFPHPDPLSPCSHSHPKLGLSRRLRLTRVTARRLRPLRLPTLPAPPLPPLPNLKHSTFLPLSVSDDFVPRVSPSVSLASRTRTEGSDCERSS